MEVIPVGRISRNVMFMQMAHIASMRSTCFRLNVGAIVTMDNRPISVGWNGAESGAPHCMGNECPGIVPGHCGTLHAEANALNGAARIVKPRVKVDLYTTHSPCAECTLLIRNSALYVKRIFFEVPYRNTFHLRMFADEYPDPEMTPAFKSVRKTEVYEITPAGYIVEYFTRKVVELP